jgi:hypothetical protein
MENPKKGKQTCGTLTLSQLLAVNCHLAKVLFFIMTAEDFTNHRIIFDEERGEETFS